MKQHAPRRGGGFARFGFVAATVMIIAAVATLPSVFANLTGSTFDGGDGNLVVDDEATDWANLGIDCVGTVKVGCALDKQNSQTDDAFGQGTSEDDPVPTVVQGGIPDNKSDLSRFYVAGAVGSNSHNFVYLAWERVQEPTGTTNMDFELNQNSCPGDTCSANGVTPRRKAGDVLIKYDLASGGDDPELGFHVWRSAVSGGTCQKNGKVPPCWGTLQTLGANGESSINSASAVDDPINPNATRSLSTNTFGEASVDLTGAGLIPAGSCEGFASAYLKSRSSDSFAAAVKDFVAPIEVNLNNCATVNVHKQDDAGNPLEGVVFTLHPDLGTGTNLGPPDGNGTQQDQHGAEDVASAKSCTTNASGNCTIEDVTFGNYWVVEGTPPSGYSAAPDQYVAVTAGGQIVNLTFANPRKHRVIVLVCHHGTNTLVASDVTNGSTTRTSLGSGASLPDGVSQAELCGLGGATFGDKTHVDDERFDVDIGKVGGSAH